MASNNATASGQSSGLLISAGLFFTTVLASQWLQHRMRGRTAKSKTGDPRSKSSMKSHFEGSDDDLHQNNDEESHKEQERHNRIRAQRQRVRRQREIIQEYEELERQQQKQQQNAGVWKYSEFHTLGIDDVADSGDDTGGYQEDSEPFPNEPHSSYIMRRAQNRLSFENLRPLVQEGLEEPENLNLVQGAAAASKQQPQLQQKKTGPASDFLTPLSPEKSHKTKGKSHQRNPRRRAESVADREDEYDFLPKNSNWNHFERFSEEDLQSGLVVPASGGRHYHHQHHYQPFSHGYIHESSGSVAGAPMDESVQSHVSNKSAASNNNQQDDGNSSDTSEEPQFVWTEALHEKKRSGPKTTKASSMASEELISTEYEQPVVFQRDTNEPSVDSELPSPNRPDRLSLTESVETVHTGNTAMDVPPPPPQPNSGTPRAANQKSRDPRQFLRHEDSIGADSTQQEQGWLPQRFARPISSKSLSRSSSGASLASTGSEMSRSSSSSHNLGGGRRKKHTSSSNEPSMKQSRHSARAQYNAKIMPNKVVMIRHGQSMGNVDETLYSTTPDNAMPLTKLGWEQARKAGKHLKESVLAPLESVHFIVSPYARAVETFHGIVSAYCDPDSPEFASIPNREMRLQAWYGRLLEMGLTWHEDPRIREQDFGNYQIPELIRKAKRDRHRFGTFYYRFPHGESASDVFDRVSTFLDSLWRSFDMNRSRNYVLVTHGISIRVLLARYFRYTIHQFNMLANPRNCDMVVLGHDGLGRLRLQGRYQLHLKEVSEANANKASDDGKEDARTSDAPGSDASSVVSKEQIVDEYRFYKRLRILPQAAIRKVDIRISYSEARPMSTSPLPKCEE